MPNVSSYTAPVLTAGQSVTPALNAFYAATAEHQAFINTLGPVAAASGNVPAYTSGPAIAGSPATLDLSLNSVGFANNLISSPQTGYTKRSAFAMYAVVTNHTSVAITVQTQGNTGGDSYVWVYVNGVFQAVAACASPAGTASPAVAPPVTVTIALPAGDNKLVQFRSGAASYQNGGYYDCPITQLAFSGGSAVATATVAKRANFFASLGDSIWSSIDPAAANPDLGLLPKLKASLTTWDVYSVSASGSYAARRFSGAASRQALAQSLATAASGSTRKLLWVEDGTNDFGFAGNTPAAYAFIIGDICDRLRALDPAFKVVLQTATYRGSQATPIGGFILDDYRVALRGVYVGREAYTTVVEAGTLLDPAVDYLAQNEVLHPNDSGNTKIVNLINTTLSSAGGANSAGTTVYARPTVAARVVRRYPFLSDINDTSGNALNLAKTAGAGATPADVLFTGAPDNAVRFTYAYGARYLTGSGSPLDTFLGGLRLAGSFKMDATTDTYHNLLVQTGSYNVQANITSGSTTGQVQVTLTRSDNTTLSLLGPTMNLTTAFIDFLVVWDGTNATLTINGVAGTPQPLDSLYCSQAGFAIADTFGGEVRNIEIDAAAY